MKTRYILLVLVTMLICFILALQFFVYESARAVREISHGISQEFKNAFDTTPLITVNNRVVVSESHAIAELATASRTLSTETTLTSTWLHSTKTISVRGVFVGKAGFDLNESVKIDLRTTSKQVTITLPEPKILSVEMTQSEITDQQGGIVNWLSPDDYQAALKQLNDVAKQQLVASSIQQAAKDEMEKRIRAMAALKGLPVKIQYEPGPIIIRKLE